VQEARDLANTCFTLLTVIMAALTIIGITFSPAIVGLMFPGFRELPGKFGMTVFLNRLMFPYIFFISLVALCMGILNTVRHFFTPAISTVLLNVSMILCALFLHDRFQVPIVSLAVGVLIGGLLQLILQLPTLYRKGFGIRPRFEFRHPAVRRIALLMGPSVFGVGVYYLNLTVSNILASLLPQGSVSYLYYAQRLFEFPQGIITVSVAQAVLPSMSRQAAAGEVEQLKESLRFGLKITLFITIPAMVGLMVCATPIFSLLFMGGEFNYATAVKSAEALSFYSLGLAVVALSRVLIPAFYALKDTRTPVVTAFIAFLLNAALSLLLMGPLLHGGLALATTLSAAGNLMLLLFLLRRKIGSFGSGRIFRSGLRTLVASVPMGFLVHCGIQLTDWSQNGHKAIKAVVLCGSIGAGVLLFIATAHLIRCEEVREAGALLRRRFQKK
jgi:putative peptidoglycan lipid II flippase